MTTRRPPFETPSARARFYREELHKHWRCLEQQREHYSEKAMADVETALRRLMSCVDQLCADDGDRGDRIISQLLRQIDGVTRLSAWSDRKSTH